MSVGMTVKACLHRGAWAIVLPLAFAFAAAPACAGESGAVPLRYDGVYRSPEHVYQGVHFRNYLRFYADGEVISTSYVGTLQDLSHNFGRNQVGYPRSHVRVRGRHLSFRERAKEGVIEYSGEIQEDGAIHFRIRSRINGFEETVLFRFVPLALPQDRASR